MSAPAAGVARSRASISRIGGQERSKFQPHLRQAALSHVVRRGDTLSEIVYARLKSAGHRLPSTELYERVREVATANGIADPDVIAVGQTLDLSVLNDKGGIQAAPAAKRAMVQSPRTDSEARHLCVDHLVAGSRLSSGFGARNDPFDGAVKWHRGLDIAAERGAEIFPAAEGEVVYAGWRGGYGKTIILRHSDGTETLYAHAERLLVATGDRVERNDAIGHVGSSGRSTAPHLHFEVLRNGVAVDPLASLGALGAD